MVPDTSDVNVTAVVGLPEHTVSASGVFDTNGFGLTVITCVMGIPAHPLAVGVIVIETVPAVLFAFVNVHEGIGFVIPPSAAPVMPGDETVDHE